MTNDLNAQVTQAIRGFGENLTKLGQPQWGSSFVEIAVLFEKAITDEERSRLAEDGVTYFTHPHGIDDWGKTLKGMPDTDLYRLLEAQCLLTRELLKRYL